MTNVIDPQVNRRQFLAGTSAVAGTAAATSIAPNRAQAQPGGPPSPYTTAERDRRWAALRSMMNAAGVDCLVVPTLPGDFTLHYSEYVGNVRDGSGQGTVILPAEGQAIAVGMPPRPDAWYHAERAMPGMTGSTVARIVNELGHGRDRIGIVGTATGQNFGLNDFSAHGLVLYSVWSEIQAGLPNADFVDLTSQFAEVAMVKGPEEMVTFEAAAQLGEQFHSTLLENTRPGLTDREFRAMVAEFLILNGATADVQALEIRPGPIQRGHVINSEYGIEYGGGYAQVTLCMSVGEPSPLSRELHEVARDCFAAGLDLVKPGIRFADVIGPMEKLVADAGYWHGFPVLHGMRPVVLAGPVRLAPPPMGGYTPIRGGDIVLKPGMSLSFEPGARTGPMDQVKIGASGIVTDDGFRVFNTLGATLQRV